MDRTGNALRLVEELSKSATEQEVAETYYAAVKPFGVRYFITGAASNLARGGIETTWANNWPIEWVQRHIESGLIAYDPVAHAIMKGESFSWRDLKVTDRRAQQLMSEAAEIGMSDGHCFIDSSRGWPMPFVTVAGENFDWTKIELGTVGFLSSLLVARMLHLREAALMPETTPLTLREVEVLNHAAIGHSDKMTARSLDVSPDTIRAHWRTIRRKLRATDRAQAVAIGLWKGEIAP